MYQYLNVHPQNKSVRDCVVRALTLATGNDYIETRKELNRLKRDNGFDSYKTTKFLKKFIYSKYEKLSFQAVRGHPRMNGQRFTEAYKTGTYILNMARHLTVCKNGVIYDIFDCTDKCVYTAFKVN